MGRLLLGPIVGHTDERSTTIWAQMSDAPERYSLRIRGIGSAPFVSTEQAVREFGTALAFIEGLEPDRRYRYQILRNRRVLPGASGSFRTMPRPGSLTPESFVVVSCNHQLEPGAWSELGKTIEDFAPRFLLMMGDQVYIDQSGDVWKSHLHATPFARRQALAQKYQQNWSAAIKRKIMANIPTYMMWDDHEIRDGWGSWAPDSPTLANRYPRSPTIVARHQQFFEDARDVFWHFQMCHNPPVPRPTPGIRAAMPFTVRAGRSLFLVLDSRGARDTWRPDQPVLGPDQWEFIETLITNLPADVDMLAIMTSTPIVSMSPRSLAQATADRLEHLAPDVRLLRRGAERRLANLITQGGTNLPKQVIKVRAKIDELRDQWSHHYSRPEQEALIRLAAQAQTINRPTAPRAVVFLGGDIHMGAIFEITLDRGTPIACLVSSGISQVANKAIDSLVTVDEDFEVAPGIQAHQRQIAQAHNHGLLQVIPTQATPKIVHALVHAGAPASLHLQINR